MTLKANAAWMCRCGLWVTGYVLLSLQEGSMGQTLAPITNSVLEESKPLTRPPAPINNPVHHAASLSAIAPLEQFKAFISSPPVIKKLIFQRKVPMGGGARPLDGTFALSTTFEYFHAKWQADGMLLRRLTSPTDVTNFSVAGQLISDSGHQHALVEPKPQLTTWDDRDPTVAGKRMSVFYTRQVLLEPLLEVMNLGIMYAGIGTIRWEGNRFRAQYPDQDHLVITGEVVPAADGPPRAMRVTYEFPDQTSRYVVRYGYAARTQSSFLPTTITNFWITKNQQSAKAEIELDEWRILDLETAGTPSSAEAFNVAPFARANRWATRVYTNDAIYELQTNGILQLAYSLKDFNMPVFPVVRASPAALYASWGALNILIFALMVGAKQPEKQ